MLAMPPLLYALHLAAKNQVRSREERECERNRHEGADDADHRRHRRDDQQSGVGGEIPQAVVTGERRRVGECGGG
jgi:hypothetical protein